MSFENLEVKTFEDHAGIVMILMKNGKDRRNILRKSFLEELKNAIHFVEKRLEPKVIILSGGGRVFSLGADLLEIGELSYSETASFSRQGQDLMHTIRQTESIVIAAVNGMALGGGFELAMACNIRWVHTRAVFAFPECIHGLIPAWSGTWMARHLIPSSLAQELLMTGRKIGAKTAYEAGIASRIFEGKNFHRDVVASAGEFTRISQDVLLDLKKIMTNDLPFRKHLDIETNVFATFGGKKTLT